MFKRTIGVVVFLFLFVSTSNAHPISIRTKVSCMSDYYRFCSDWPNNELRRCFQMNVLRVSHGCVDALVDESLITRTEVNQMKTQALALYAPRPAQPRKEVPSKKPSPDFERWKRTNGFN